jgi:hypothetical protein
LRIETCVATTGQNFPIYGTPSVSSYLNALMRLNPINTPFPQFPPAVLDTHFSEDQTIGACSDASGFLIRFHGMFAGISRRVW